MATGCMSVWRWALYPDYPSSYVDSSARLDSSAHVRVAPLSDGTAERHWGYKGICHQSTTIDLNEFASRRRGCGACNDDVPWGSGEPRQYGRATATLGSRFDL